MTVSKNYLIQDLNIGFRQVRNIGMALCDQIVSSGTEKIIKKLLVIAQCAIIPLHEVVSARRNWAVLHLLGNHPKAANDNHLKTGQQ